MIRFPAGYDSLNRIKRYQDYYQASYGVMLLSAGQFSPLSLFAAGEQGAWYDPSDLDRYMSGLGTEGSPALSEYVTVLTGTWAASGANYIFTDTVGGQSRPGVQYPTTSLVAGWYRVVVVVAAINGATQIRMDGVGAADQLLTVGTNTYTLNVTSTSRPRFRLEDLSTTIGDSFTITSISIKEVTSVSSATMFTDAAGTTPVTAVEQPVGLLLDKSKGLALGAELVTNGTFNTNTTGWTSWQTGTLSVDTSRLKVENGAATISGAYQLITVVVGRTYKFEGVKEAGTAASPRFYLGTSVGGTQYAASATSGQVFLATSTTLVVTAATQSTVLGATAFFDNISIKELPGNHASQSTAASRPVLSARVNLLTFSEQFDNAVWTKQNGAISANAETAPNGTLTADKFTPTAAASTDHRVITGVITTTGGYTLALYVKPAGYSKFGFRNGAIGEHATFNLSGAGAVIEQNSCTASITAEAAGWYKVQIVSTSASTRCDFWALNDAYTSGNPGAYSYTGDGTSGIYLWGADLRVTNVGVGLPAYQRVAAATDYDTSNFPLYLKFDGVDDSLATGTIDFSATDKMSVFAGVRKLSDAAIGMIAEFSADTNSFNGVFNVYGPSSPGSGDYFLGSKGTLGVGISGVSSPTSVYTGLINFAAPLATLRLKGVQSATTSASQGTGNFGNYPLYIGRRGGSTLPYNGNLYSLIIRGALSTDAQIASTETYVNNLTKAY